MAPAQSTATTTPQRALPQTSAQRRSEALQRAIEQGHPTVKAYGLDRGSKLVTLAPDFESHGTVVTDAHGRARGGGSLDEQARTELAALPKYGEVGYRDSKRRSREIHQAAAERAAAARVGGAEAQDEHRALAGAQGRQDLTWADIHRAARSGQDLSSYVVGEHRPVGR